MSETTPTETQSEAESKNRLAHRLDRIEAKLDKLTRPIDEDESRNSWAMPRFVSKAEKHWFTRLLLLSLAIAAGFSLYEFREERKVRAEERIARTEERIARAWHTLSAPNAGNSGKGRAIELLLQHDQNLDYLTLGASRTRRVTVEDLNGQELRIQHGDLRFVDWYGLDVQEIYIGASWLDDSTISGSFTGNFGSVTAVGANLTRFEMPETATLSLKIDRSVFDYAFLELIDTKLDPISSDLSVISQIDGVPVIIEPYREIDAEIAFSSLRCTVLDNLRPGEIQISTSNVSGAILDVRAFDQGPPKTKPVSELPVWSKLPVNGVEFTPDGFKDGVGYVIEPKRLNEIEISDPTDLNEAFVDSFYFSDNPPIGLPENVLSEVLTQVDRAETLALCKKDQIDNPKGARDFFSPTESGAICTSFISNPEPCRLGEHENTKWAASSYLRATGIE